MICDKIIVKFSIVISFILAIAIILPFSADALTVSPPRIELTGDPGQTITGSFGLFNEQDTHKTFYSSYENFEARGETGTPYFLPGEEGLAVWIETDSQVSLEPDERKSIPFTIRIPQNAEPGGHFAAIFWGTTPPQVGEGQVAIGGKVGILVLLKVSGDIQEGGGILELNTAEGKVLSSLPVTFIYRFSNDGGDRIKPEGEIKIKNTLGFTAATLDANKGEGNILPGSIRKFTAIWHSGGQKEDDLTKKEELALMAQITNERKDKKGFFETARIQWSNFAFGMYNAELSLSYGQDDQTAEASFRFFVIPWQLLSIIITMLAIFGFFGSWGLRRYNRWIIKKAQADM